MGKLKKLCLCLTPYGVIFTISVAIMTICYYAYTWHNAEVEHKAAAMQEHDAKIIADALESKAVSTHEDKIATLIGLANTNASDHKAVFSRLDSIDKNQLETNKLIRTLIGTRASKSHASASVANND